MSKSPNPPAFPSDRACQSWQCRKPSEGMTLRDYFAAKAMMGGISNAWPDDEGQIVAEMAYQVADAMLAERSKQ